MSTKFVIDEDNLVNFVRCILCLKAKGNKIINNQTFFWPKHSRRKKITSIILRVKVGKFYENNKCAHIIM